MIVRTIKRLIWNDQKSWTRIKFIFRRSTTFTSVVKRWDDCDRHENVPTMDFLRRTNWVKFENHFLTKTTKKIRKEKFNFDRKLTNWCRNESNSTDEKQIRDFSILKQNETTNVDNFCFVRFLLLCDAFKYLNECPFRIKRVMLLYEQLNFSRALNARRSNSIRRWLWETSSCVKWFNWLK